MNIAICPEVKIRNFGIIKIPPKPRATKQSPKLFAVFRALLKPVLDPFPIEGGAAPLCGTICVFSLWMDEMEWT